MYEENNCHFWVGFILQIQIWFDIWKSINIYHLIRRLKEKLCDYFYWYRKYDKINNKVKLKQTRNRNKLHYNKW